MIRNQDKFKSLVGWYRFETKTFWTTFFAIYYLWFSLSICFVNRNEMDAELLSFVTEALGIITNTLSTWWIVSPIDNQYVDTKFFLLK